MVDSWWKVDSCSGLVMGELAPSICKLSFGEDGAHSDMSFSDTYLMDFRGFRKNKYRTNRNSSGNPSKRQIRAEKGSFIYLSRLG